MGLVVGLACIVTHNVLILVNHESVAVAEDRAGRRLQQVWHVLVATEWKGGAREERSATAWKGRSGVPKGERDAGMLEVGGPSRKAYRNFPWPPMIGAAVPSDRPMMGLPPSLQHCWVSCKRCGPESGEGADEWVSSEPRAHHGKNGRTIGPLGTSSSIPRTHARTQHYALHPQWCFQGVAGNGCKHGRAQSPPPPTVARLTTRTNEPQQRKSRRLRWCRSRHSERSRSTRRTRRRKSRIPAVVLQGARQLKLQGTSCFCRL